MARKTLGVRTNRKEDLRRRTISVAAIRIFSAKGYHKATMDDIVVEAGCSKSLIYWYWKNKLALYSDLTEMSFEMFRESIQHTLKSRAPYMKKLKDLLWTWTELYGTNKQLSRLAHSAPLHRTDRSGESLADQTRQAFETIMTLLEQLFQQGIDSGSLRKDLDARVLAYWLVSSVQGFVYMDRIGEWMPVERAFVAPWIEYVLPSLTPTVRSK